MSFLGMQPTLTQVPPRARSSASAARAPWRAEARVARTPPEPPPIANRSKSYSAMTLPDKPDGPDGPPPADPDSGSRRRIQRADPAAGKDDGCIRGAARYTGQTVDLTPSPSNPGRERAAVRQTLRPTLSRLSCALWMLASL